MMIKSTALSSVSKTYEGMRLTITDPSSKAAYSTSCHAFTAGVIRDNPDKLPDDAKILLLGKNGEVLHSIITDKNGEILADTERQLRKISTTFNSETGIYSSRIHPNSLEETHYDVIDTVGVGEFRKSL